VHAGRLFRRGGNRLTEYCQCLSRRCAVESLYQTAQQRAERGEAIVSTDDDMGASPRAEVSRPAHAARSGAAPGVRAHPARRTVASDPHIVQWHFIVDNLNTHQSASLVRYVTEESELDIELGVKGKSGILASLESRAAFLSDPSHRIVFHDTPKHASWMNQIELRFSILEPHDGPTFSVGLSRQGARRLTIGSFVPQCTGRNRGLYS